MTVSIRIERLLWAAISLFVISVSSTSHAAASNREPFYLQLTTGFGMAHISYSVDDSGHNQYYTDSKSGGSVGMSLLTGWQFRSGMTLGIGGLLSVYMTGRSQPKGQNVIFVDVKDAPFYGVAMIGPFIDIYPSPALGWHVQALGGYSQLSRQNYYSDTGSAGFGLMAGVGHDSRISEHWSFGVLARLAYVNATLANDYSPGSGSISEHDHLIMPSLEASFTFH